MCSLAVTDIIFPLYSLYRYIEVFTHEHKCPTSHAHPLYFAISGLCTMATLGNLAVISRDRYLAVRGPAWYRNHIKISRAFRTVCLPWLISAVYAVLTYFSKRSSRVYTPMAAVFLLVLFPFYLSVITFCYLSIYCRKNIQVGNLNEALLKREKRLANTVAWILLILVLTYFPGLLFGGVLVAKGVIIIFPFGLITSFLCNCLLNVSRIKKKAIVGWVIIWFSAHCWKMFCIKYSSNEHVQCLYDLLQQVIFFVVIVHTAGTRLPRFRQ